MLFSLAGAGKDLAFPVCKRKEVSIITALCSTHKKLLHARMPNGLFMADRKARSTNPYLLLGFLATCCDIQVCINAPKSSKSPPKFQLINLPHDWASLSEKVSRDKRELYLTALPRPRNAYKGVSFPISNLSYVIWSTIP